MQSQNRQRRSLSQWLQDNWLELLLVLILLAALAWTARTALALWPRTQAEPALVEESPVPVLEGGEAAQSPTPAPAPTPTRSAAVFDSARAQQLVASLVDLGPRQGGSEGLAQAGDLIAEELRRAGWQVEEQTFEVDGRTLRNVIARTGTGPVVLLGTHYDSSPSADLDPTEENRSQPPPGANDGASGSAVLLALAGALETDKLSNEVWLAFFDGQYGATAEPVSLGARRLAESLAAAPQAVVLLDQVGGADGQFFFDNNSDPALNQALWAVAERLGYARWFVPEARHSLDNGVLAFRERSFPAINLADFDYPYRHTLADTPDKIAADSLERVGRVLEVYLEGQ